MKSESKVLRRFSFNTSIVFLITFLTVWSLAWVRDANAQARFDVLHAFSLPSDNRPGDGANPQSAPIQGSDGNFYGTTNQGGMLGVGTVYRMTPDGIVIVLHSFSGCTNGQAGCGIDGAWPFAGLFQAVDGSFYGTTESGGGAGLGPVEQNIGTIFKMTADGTVTTLHVFSGLDGYTAYGGLVLGSDGNLWGTTVAGGASRQGNIFKLTLDGQFSVVYAFTGGTDGAQPTGGLAQGTDGYFYGTAQSGGDYGVGTIFKIALDGTFTVLHEFTGDDSLDGGIPFSSLIQATDGSFYGTTQGLSIPGGTIFKMTPDGTVTVLHRFTGGTDGAQPYAPLIQAADGNFYGTTLNGGGGACMGVAKYGSLPGCGTVFEVTSSGAFATLHVFTSLADGMYPVAGLIQGRDGLLYGTASSGPCDSTYSNCGMGLIFRLDPRNTPAGTKVTPTVSWPVPAAISYGTVLSATQLNATASVPGTFAYSPAAGTVLPAGNQTLSVIFTPTDTADYTTATANSSLTVSQATPTVSWPVPAAISYGTALSATQLSATASVPGTFAYSPAAGTVLPAGNQTLSVTFTPTDTADYTTATANSSLTVSQATPTVSWPVLAAISYGTALSATQLSATASVPGTFAYSPAAGTVLPAGNQTLSVTFTPTDTADCTTATANSSLTVSQATPTVSWPVPAAISYGTALSATQLDATASVSGTFAYSPGAGTVLPAGNQTLSVIFTPMDTTDYTAATANISITVSKVTTTLSWPVPPAISYGTALSATQLSATASVSGTFAYSPAAGTVLSAGNQTLSVTFTPTDTTDYTPATATTSITVSKVTPIVSWPVPAAISYGTALSATQLDATASVPGTFAYSPAAGTVLPAGNQTLSVTFTSMDTTDYTPATATTSLTVRQTHLAYADQGSITNTGSSANPSGTFSYSGTNLTFVSADGLAAINATFATHNTTEFCSGGGKGGHVTCSFTFTGSFRGTLTVNGSTQAINGTTTQVYGSSGISSGVTAYNSSYTPLYFTDGNARILRSDDLSGTNAIAYGTQGTDVGQFYGPSGIALDSAGRIYITDTYNDRIVRIDDINGTNWASFGAYGTGVGQFARPQSISVDPAGHIWVLDNGNGRLIRMDDMNGTNWTTVGSGGSGVGQFAALSSAPGFDALGRIYVADAGNNWIVRFDDLNFTNWTTLSQSQPIGPYIFLFGGPTGVGTDQAGRIYVVSGTNVIRVDDMTGTNWTSISVGTFAPHTIAVDSDGLVVLGNGYNAQIVDSEATVLTSNISGLVQGVYVSVYGVVPLSLPSPRPSAISLTPPALNFTQNVGTSASQNITIANFGGSPLDIGTISATAGFSIDPTATNCPNNTVAAGSNCTVGVTFAPSVTGPVTGVLTVNDDSGNLGAVQTIALAGVGTAPVAAVTPASLAFSSQVQGNTSAAKTVTVSNTGTGPMQVTGVTATAPFIQTNTCTASIAAGSSCTISVSFAPTTVGAASGTLTIVDDPGTQTVSLTGNGTAQVTVSSSSLNFGTLAVGNTSAAKTVTLTNRGSAALSFSNIGTTGAFAIASNTCAASLAAGANCIVGVTFTPAATGATTGALSFTDSALNSPQTVNLSGTGSAPVTLSASTLSFNTVAVGNTSSARTVTFTNQQSAALAFSSIATSGAFAIASNTCGTGIASGASCAVGVTFTPVATGAATGTLTFTDNAPGSPPTVNLTGTGSSTSSPVTLSASSLNFGTLAVGGTSGAMTVTLTNRQSVSLTFSNIGTSGAFAIASNSCGTGIAAGANCIVGVTFSPTVTGAASGTLTFTDSAANSPQKVSLTGTAKAPVTLSSSTLNFGVVAVGATSASQSVTVTNASAAAIAVNSVTISGDFSDTTTCASSIAAGSSCTVTVTFSPSAGGARTGALTVNLSTGAQTVSLTGTGSSSSQSGVLSSAPSPLGFSGYTIGDNPSKSVTITNTSGASTGIAGIAMSGDPSFTERNNCGVSLAAGASCSITVTFTPVAYGTFTGTLTVTEASGALDTVSVTGNSSPDN